ncbi:MAG: HAD-IA family hydrolase [Clostridiales bacterium]|nr:HAD-IA family hydrolase [Clostridiales bacterium]
MIDTVLFDMGGTLEDIVSTPDTLQRAAQGITRILNHHNIPVQQSDTEMQMILLEGLKRYGDMRDESNIELKPERIWADYMLSDSGINLKEVEEISEEMACAWENLYFERSLRPGVADMLEGLSSLGLKLGIVSNTASLYHVFEQLDKYGIRKYFSDVTLSSVVGYRKPHPNIFHIALRQMRSRADSSVYVGDTVSRDILGSSRANFSHNILIHSQLTKQKDEELIDAPKPDFAVEDITQVLQICQSLVNEKKEV